IMSEYTGFVKDVLIAENEFGGVGDASIVIEGTPGGDVLEKIIAPYRGNVLFLDFWGIGCGPCRAGMQRQKPWLDELAGQPFRALYIANADENKEACERWLRNEEIKGEHIFVTGDDWMRLCALFTITGIPHGVLIGKDGKVIAPDYNFYPEEIKFQEALRK
ncbi:MAG: TlpA family protein disulfide reductase, partial [Muribaculaceae bacterium]|nr:TlpA family protein disulfide reductase [Muribaculaceae bacterium]